MEDSIIQDIKDFYKYMGGMDELCSRDYNYEDMFNFEDDFKYLQKFIKKYNLNYEDKGFSKVDTLEYMEYIIDEYFTEVLMG